MSTNEKNELTIVDESLNHVVDGAFAGEQLQLRDGVYYIGTMPITEENYERIDIVDPKAIREQKAKKKKNIGIEAVGTVALPVLMPLLIKDWDAFSKEGTLINITWNTGESSTVYIDLQTEKKLLAKENAVVGVAKDLARMIVNDTKTPVILQDILERDDLPSVLMIVDDALYKDDAALKGAVGWREIVKGQQVLYLFDEAVKASGLTLKPNMECDAVYYVHPHNRRTYLLIDNMFQIAQEEREAELKQIAYDLGAVHYTIETKAEENTKKHLEAKKTDNVNVKVVEGSTEISMKEDSLEKKQIEIISETIHAAGREPQRPQLVWFASNNDIQNLVNNRLNDTERTSFTEDVYIKGSTCALMSMRVAGKVGLTVKKIGGDKGFDFRSDVEDEHRQSLRYHLEF